MKIALFGNSTWCLYNFREGLIRELVAMGHEVHVLAPLDPTYDNASYLAKLERLGARFCEVPLLPRSLNPLVELKALSQLFRTLASINPDIVLTYTVKCNLYTGLCRLVLRFQQIANIPGLGEVFERRSLVQQIVRTLYRISFRGMHTAFLQNEEDRAQCVRQGLVREEICRLVPGSGVNLTRFAPSFPPRSPGKRRFLMFGRLLPQKGYHLYLRAAHELRALAGDKAECWIMGIPDRNRPDSIALAQTIQQAHDEGIVRCLPPAVDVVPILNQIDVVVLPSNYNEGVPRSLLEAMACGKAILTSDWKGCRDTVRHGVNGFLVPVQDAKSLTQAMLKLIEMDDTELAQMGIESRRAVEHKYNERAVIESYLQAIGAPPQTHEAFIPAVSKASEKFAEETTLPPAAVSPSQSTVSQVS